ncbi:MULTISPECIES: NADH-quinone oxidoreductase subunit NuoH [Comamonas]|jgi:NADH-quinone oxidoreductase subunit H|uniref:NADH-quinone oxidoreductase subunit H n=1 Tax=Comamonas terrigena TaxID=32013 RepID=A0A2A7UTK4_COMTR|nr:MULTISPECIES: NADH-quinone oxidoreductase subunit NuoH [Comamonas]MBD9532430.1 NADH-quinone oxidoreductase subunit NuoH [Comamonas sp. CMM01]MDH1290701.1 NADH-quinone oxidoreductase subunit NuoH [Comamonas terrigena]MDH1700839.1 NADH-quinone oxidoreductase subunit NuoH [Comamonas terrigena]MDI9855729.1 NADH-quinone oxidoreductase subunit NuoH [Comamonas sp. 17RB]PEH88608.1 NADH-quinone oxidoreductase subunit NuoH [Comamonas terrigena]
MIDALKNAGAGLIAASWWTDVAWPVIWVLLGIIAIVAPLMIAVAYLTLWERKFLGWIQVRPGPNRVGPWGLLQPMADGLKLLTKELIFPSAAAKGLFYVGPVMAIMPALAAWVAIPFAPEVALANVNAGLLLIMAITSIEVYGVIIAGWASNSKYAFLGALRASAQMVSYEIAMGFCFLVVIMVSGSMNLTQIVLGQGQGHFASMGVSILSWNWLPLLPIFIVYLISVVAETNRHPFDVVEGESEIVAGHMVEYSGMGFAIFFLAEYASMWLVSILAVIMFLGGWLPPFDFLGFIPGWIWLAIKTFLVVSCFIWIRATFPRFRYDQIMRLGWKIFIPVTLVWLVLVGAWLHSPWNIWN